jgi:hypothetical protein
MKLANIYKILDDNKKYNYECFVVLFVSVYTQRVWVCGRERENTPCISTFYEVTKIEICPHLVAER